MGAQPKPSREVIRKMLDDVEAVTKGRFYEDPEPIASPIEMFLVPDGRPGGEAFAQLSMREKHQVFGDYVDWQAYEAGGISFEQLDQVFWNAAQGKPRDQWLDGTGLQDQDRTKSLAVLKDRGKPEDMPSRAGMVTTDTERKLIWMETIRRLDAAYMVGGTDALAKMNGIETYVLYAEKMAELEAVTKSLAEHGNDEIGQLHRQKLERQTADMAAWMQEHFIDFRKAEPEATAEKVGRLLTCFLRDDELSPPDAADFCGTRGLAVPWEKRQHTELKEHGTSKTSLAELKEMGKEKTRQPEHRESRDKEIER